MRFRLKKVTKEGGKHLEEECCGHANQESLVVERTLQWVHRQVGREGLGRIICDFLI